MRKVSYHCAISLDGYVACKDGSFDCFTMQGPHVTDFLATLGTYDVALMGRRTYEVGLKYGVTNPYPSMKTYVFSRTLKESPDANVTIVSADGPELVRKLKEQDGKDIWVVGAGDLATTLFAEELVDEVTLKINPVMLGEGIPVVSHLKAPVRFDLIGSKAYDNGVVLLSYRLGVGSEKELRP